MALSQYRPFDDPFFAGWGLAPRMPGWPANAFQTEPVSLGACDIVETKDAHIVKADAPGLTSKDVKVQVTDDNTLTISGERKQEHEEKTDKIHRVERSYGRFVRSFPLPANADTTKVSASVDHGVISVIIPKKPEAVAAAKSTDIPITSKTS